MFLIHLLIHSSYRSPFCSGTTTQFISVLSPTEVYCSPFYSVIIPVHPLQLLDRIPQARRYTFLELQRLLMQLFMMDMVSKTSASSLSSSTPPTKRRFSSATRLVITAWKMFSSVLPSITHLSGSRLRRSSRRFSNDFFNFKSAVLRALRDFCGWFIATHKLWEYVESICINLL